MGLFDKVAFWRQRPEAKPRRRSYDAASLGRLFADWATISEGPNTEVRMALSVVRARSRNLAHNNDYAKRFLRLLTQNVIGDQGILMLPDARAEGGKADEDANRKIAAAWARWGRRGVCTTDGRLSFYDVQRLFIATIARDGEGLSVHVRGNPARNPFGYALQILEPDHLDERYDAQLAGNARVVMGVEMDGYHRPLGYHVLTVQPNENYVSPGGARRQRIAAENMLHPYVVERANQVRGMPWMHTAMRRLQMLGGYEHAEVVAARAGASKMGFYTSPDGTPPGSDDQSADGKSDFVHEAEPGTFGVLPPGYDFTPWDPQHPNGAFNAFVKAMLRGVASGLDVSYNALANDLEGVNYSSLRQGALDDRDGWRCVQRWYIDNVLQPIYEQWLTMAVTTGAVDLPARKLDNYLTPRWKPRGWQWVDPLKEVNANVIAIDKGLKSRHDVHAEQGREVEDTFAELQKEKDLAAKYGLEFSGKQSESAPGGANADEEEDD